MASTGTPQVVAVVSGMPSPPAGPGTPGTVPGLPLTPTQVGLGNVTNDAQVKRSEMGSANGVASLDGTGLVPTAQIPLATAVSPGSMSAVDNRTLHLSTTTTNSGGAAAGDLVRVVSAGVLAKALADSAANSAGMIGIWDGATVSTLVGYQVVTFVAAPVVGLPAYLSGVTAGAASNFPNLLGLNPIGIVVEDLSVGAAYSARVLCPAATSLMASSAREAFCARVVAMTGADPKKLLTFYEQFERVAAAANLTAAGGTITYDGMGIHGTANSVLVLSNLLAGAAATAWGGWRYGFGAKIKCTSVNTDFSVYLTGNGYILCLRLTTALGLRLYYGAGNPQGSVYPATFYQVAAAGAITMTQPNLLEVFGLGTNAFYVAVGNTLYGPYTIADNNVGLSLWSVTNTDGGVWSEIYYSGDHRG